MEECIVCGRKLEPEEEEECESCRDLLNQKYKRNNKARKKSKKFFRWLKSKGGEPNENL